MGSVARLAVAMRTPPHSPPCMTATAMPSCAVHVSCDQRHQIPLAGKRRRAWTSASLRVTGRHRAVEQGREQDARLLVLDERLDVVVRR